MLLVLPNHLLAALSRETIVPTSWFWNSFLSAAECNVRRRIDSSTHSIVERVREQPTQTFPPFDELIEWPGNLASLARNGRGPVGGKSQWALRWFAAWLAAHDCAVATRVKVSVRMNSTKNTHARIPNVPSPNVSLLDDLLLLLLRRLVSLPFD